MFADFIARLDTSDHTAMTTTRALWDAWVAETPQAIARTARRRDLESALRERFPVGVFNHKLTVGGVALAGTPRRSRWTVTNGRLKLAINRERGALEAGLIG